MNVLILDCVSDPQLYSCGIKRSERNWITSQLGIFLGREITWVSWGWKRNGGGCGLSALLLE